ncbi:quinone oxidoreductase [Bradyrhizobium oligotrophicum S58]|uniref:Quinone oxidoreductase n=1 Tax=Bradyrhizobium oligotrophicum S58 TaxID=1245469 RepID=M4ZEP1_9BRAD|nr:zinc-binding alcohol dehydrogenase family protein [Bradyrhizobium oligotrophicum]BAM92209.1 quinone oxidoreductase [Bradyrhizobium oligotrophicum S58]
MKAAIVRHAGQTPTYGDFESPVASAGEHLIDVSAAAISPLTRGRASGTHYSSDNAFPFVPGIDGVGRREDGGRVYFVLPRAPHGAMAEQTVVPAARCLPLPADLDDITAAAIANPGLSSWAALKERARLRTGETVLINGATGISGRLAIQIAKHLGAAKVIATGRDSAALHELAALGADATIALVEDGEALERSFKPHVAAGVDIVLDYLWGPSAQRLLIAAARAATGTVPIRFVQIGSASGGDITLPSAALRASPITLMGSGIGSIPLERLVALTAELLQAAVPAGLRVAVDPAPLSDIDQSWTRESGHRRTVMTM